MSRAVLALPLALILFAASGATAAAPSVEIDSGLETPTFVGAVPWTWCGVRMGSGGYCIDETVAFTLVVTKDEAVDVTEVRLQARGAVGSADCTLKIHGDETSVAGTLSMLTFGSVPCESFYASLGGIPDTDLCAGHGRVGGLQEGPVHDVVIQGWGGGPGLCG